MYKILNLKTWYLRHSIPLTNDIQRSYSGLLLQVALDAHYVNKLSIL